MYEFNKFYYKPLPTCLEIKTSKIEGMGIFATEDIAKEIDLGMTHIKVPILNGYVRTPIGGFVNHAKESNCFLLEKIDWDDYRIYNLITEVDIKAGDELTLNYHIDEEV